MKSGEYNKKFRTTLKGLNNIDELKHTVEECDARMLNRITKAKDKKIK